MWCLLGNIRLEIFHMRVLNRSIMPMARVIHSICLYKQQFGQTFFIIWYNLYRYNPIQRLYWKETKNFGDGVSYHVKDSIFINDPADGVYGILHSFLPGKQCAFRNDFIFRSSLRHPGLLSVVEIRKRMKNVTYAGSPQHGGMGAIAAPQPGFLNDAF